MKLKIPDLKPGERFRGRCPKCRRPDTFSATRIGAKVVYNCFSASCAASGSFRVGYTPEDVRAAQHPLKCDLEASEIDQINMATNMGGFRYDPVLSDFVERHGITTDGWTFDPADSRAVFLIRNETGQVVDAIGRSLIGRLPKWKRYGKSRAPLVIGSDRRNIVIVEDVISAIKLSNILPEWAAMPILGTSLSADAVTVLSSFKNGLIALDKDATDKAIQMHRRLAPFLDRCRVVMLECDIKDDTEENIRGIFKNARTDTVAM